LEDINYECQEGQVCCTGVSLLDGEKLNSFMVENVASRLQDAEGEKEFESVLRGLASTGFERQNLDEILNAKIPEERDWAVGEAIAEAYLSHKYNIDWPWNAERDKRTPKASLPGADLVGFISQNKTVRLVLGEVKTSSDSKAPPGVMKGRSGLNHQIDNLVNNLSLVSQLLRWLYPRCKGTKHEENFKTAVKLFIQSGNKDIAAFGVLIRDTVPDELDLKARAHSLSGRLQQPTTCHLTAIYMPYLISEFPKKVSGGNS
jgi:mRNA-degrading endonuclease YafQ of YafQ-DinJ toxin-antitoxin module